MSNVAARNKIQLEALFKDSATIQALVDIASQNSSRRTKKEAIHFVSNVCTNRWVTPQQVGIIAGFGGIKSLLPAREEQDRSVVGAALEGIHGIPKQVDVDDGTLSS